jgi:hypothetical protein
MTAEDCEDCSSCDSNAMRCYSELKNSSDEKQMKIDELTEELGEIKDGISDKVYDIKKHLEDMNDNLQPAITLLEELDKYVE